MMTRITYRVCQQVEDGSIWTSDDVFSGTLEDIAQTVRQGWLNGSSRWAIRADDGRWICGFDAKGGAMKGCP